MMSVSRLFCIRSLLISSCCTILLMHVFVGCVRCMISRISRRLLFITVIMLNQNLRKSMKIQRTYQMEVNEQPSLTDPSQNIELRTIVDRFVKGLPIPAVGHVLTPDDFDAVDNDHCPPSALDISEVKDAVDRATDVLADLATHSQTSARRAIDDTADAKTESSSSVPPDGVTK